jgi:hypothetical protein
LEGYLTLEIVKQAKCPKYKIKYPNFYDPSITHSGDHFATNKKLN